MRCSRFKAQSLSVRLTAERMARAGPVQLVKMLELGFATAGKTSTGNSGVNLIVGTNGAGLVTTATYAVRIVDVVDGTQTDDFPEFIVKLNVGVHSYTNSLGV
jgi:hypothetical protein